MTTQSLESVAGTLVADGKGILAADDTTPMLSKRFDALGIHSTEQTQRTYREMLITTPGAAKFIRGVIMYGETTHLNAIKQLLLPPSRGSSRSRMGGHCWKWFTRIRSTSPEFPRR